MALFPRGLAAVLALIFGLQAAPTALAAAAPVAASFPSADGTLINAWVFQPEQQPPRATVVALHGCGGLYSTRPSRQGQFNARHQAMADLLVAQGYAAVFPDSLTPRGETQLCTQRIGSRRIGQRERRADALAALGWVAAQPWGSAERIALLGWSHGGSTVLAAIDGNQAGAGEQPVRAAVAIAFYPGCGDSLRKGVRPNAPLVLMLAENDDWTPPGPCIALGQAAGAEVNVYPDSYHGFDEPVGQVRLRRDVPNGVNPGQGVHVGANPASREKAYARLAAVLREAFR
jgi:dienelactone hydrolase